MEPGTWSVHVPVPQSPLSLPGWAQRPVSEWTVAWLSPPWVRGSARRGLQARARLEGGGGATGLGLGPERLGMCWSGTRKCRRAERNEPGRQEARGQRLLEPSRPQAFVSRFQPQRALPPACLPASGVPVPLPVPTCWAGLRAAALLRGRISRCGFVFRGPPPPSTVRLSTAGAPRAPKGHGSRGTTGRRSEGLGSGCGVALAA